MTNFAPRGVITMEYANNGVLNKEMRRRYHDSSSSVSHSDISNTKDRRETSLEIRMIKVKLEVSRSVYTRILHVTIVTRMRIS